jgi:Resolvase, N terminal domain
MRFSRSFSSTCSVIRDMGRNLGGPPPKQKVNACHSLLFPSRTNFVPAQAWRLERCARSAIREYGADDPRSDPTKTGRSVRCRDASADATYEDASRRRFDVVMAWAIDRLGRSPIDLLGTIQHLEAAGVDLYLDQQNKVRRFACQQTTSLEQVCCTRERSLLPACFADRLPSWYRYPRPDPCTSRS